MSDLQNCHYKEVSPEETVHKIRNLLYDLNLFTADDWISKDRDSLCQSLRVTGKNASFGTNGKGISKEYALASAYAEFCERLQNNMLMLSSLTDTDMGFKYFADEVNLSSEELIKQGDPFVKLLCKIHEFDLSDQAACAKQFENCFRSQEYLGQEKGEYTCVPYYNLKDDKVYYLPYDIFVYYYGSNGMCAGNTPEEALSQGISEILERYVQKKVILEKLPLPDIPEAYIRKFPNVYSIYKQLKERNKDQFEYYLKDCSLGGKYPVAAFVSIEKNTGRYGVKFGAHPDYGIAMERTLTEAFQGRNGESFSHSSALDFLNRDVDHGLNIYNSFKLGIAQYPVQLFLSSQAPEFCPVPDVSELSNHEILKQMLHLIMNEGFEVLARDVSYLGFPSFQVIVPGMSELVELTALSARMANTSMFTAEKLKKLDELTDHELEIIIRCIDSRLFSHLENGLASLISLPITYPYPGNEFELGASYLAAMCRYKQGDFKDSARRLEQFLGLHSKVTLKDQKKYQCFLQYIQGKSLGFTHSEIMEVIRAFYSEELAAETERVLKEPKETLAKQYPLINCPHCETCSIKQYCDYREFKRIRDLLKQKQKSFFPNQEDLGELIKGI